ncbi:sensor domain-containing diguanylate cyclase [Marinobacter sp. F4206]|uniref:sensor domain-containing diguanylate cyclase n=1 Tax=Marinobacter sp. F4206 TaxID=2861777 RepID=UPI001C5D8DE1|nr:diguanylate cyclase [Marinobacter sp. F4206]MBW4935307.1 diguanylate cyclase [Marinobacter sp. F4206]
MATNKASPTTTGPSADFFYKLTSAAPSILFAYWLSADGVSHCYPFISDQIRERFGIDPEALGQDADAVFAIVHPDDADGLKASIFESARTLEPWQFRARLRLLDGSYQWFEAHSRPERQSDGSTVWYGQFHNIQHYKELEQELRESEAEYSFQAGFQKLVARLSTRFIHVGFGTIDDCIDELLESVGQFFAADRAYLYAFNDDYTAITKTHQWCRPGVPSLVDEDQTVPMDACESWRQKLLDMVDENEVVFIETLREVASIYCVPVRVQGQVVGFLGLDSVSSRDWRKDQADLLIIISGLLSGALERHLLEEQLLNQSIRDPMTGLHNRRYLMPRLNELVERAERYDENFTIAMLDIDHFKQINDSIGHLGGDYALRRFADILSDLVRSTDVVARFGGEEFMVVFPDTEQADVHQMISRILDAVRHGRFMFEGREIPVTVSAGVASVRERDDSMISVDTVIGRADHRLYLAKQAGRDCAVDVSGVLRI